MAQEKTFKFDDEHSYTTLNEKPGAYAGSPGAAVFQVGARNKPEAVECSRDKEEEVSVMSAASGLSTHPNKVLSREELLETMKNANISIEELTEGSAPKLHGKSRGIPSDEESSESSSSDSSSSSGTSESVGSAGRHAAGSG